MHGHVAHCCTSRSVATKMVRGSLCAHVDVCNGVGRAITAARLTAVGGVNQKQLL